MTSRSAHRAGILLALPAVVVSMFLAGVAPAHALPSERVLVSTDGINWYSGTVTGLLGDLGELVPGSSASAPLYVKNDSSTAAVLRVSAIVDAVASPYFTTELALSAALAGTNEPAVGVVPGACLALFDGTVLAAGAIATLDLTVALDAAAPNSAQNGSAPVSFFVALVEDAGALPPISCVTSGTVTPTPGPGAGLAGTGQDVSFALFGGGLLAACLLAVGGGVGAFAARRRARNSW